MVDQLRQPVPQPSFIRSSAPRASRADIGLRLIFVGALALFVVILIPFGVSLMHEMWDHVGVVLTACAVLVSLIFAAALALKHKA